MTPKVKASLSPGGQLGCRTWHLEGPSHAGIKESLTSRFMEGTFIPSSLSLPSLKKSAILIPLFQKLEVHGSGMEMGFGWATQKGKWEPQCGLPEWRVCCLGRADLQDFPRDGPSGPTSSVWAIGLNTALEISLERQAL